MCRVLVAAAVAIAGAFETALAASIGVDFGSESMTVALARSSARDVTVVPNRLGYRSSPTLVGFAENGAQRLLGSDAAALSTMCPACVVADPRSMLGMPLAAARDAQSGRAVGAFNHTLVPSRPAARGTARVTPPPSLLVEHSAAAPFEPEELVAMLLEDAASFAGGEKPESCVVAVPMWWTQPQRHAMIAAAQIAGLSHPTIVSEPAAAAMQLSHRYPPGPRGQKAPPPKTVALVSVGARAAYAR